MAVRLTAPLVRVVVAGDEEPLELQTTNMDLVLWDRTRAKRKWPKFDEAPFLWLTFLSWAAARRTGHIGSETTYEQWEGSVLDATAVDPDEEEEAGRPTHGAAAPD